MGLVRSFRRFLRDEGGATAVEYGLIAALLTVATIVSMETVGDSANGLITGIGTVITEAME